MTTEPTASVRPEGEEPPSYVFVTQAEIWDIPPEEGLTELNLLTCEALPGADFTFKEGITVAGKPAIPGNPGTPATPEATVRAAVRDRVQRKLLDAVKTAKVTCAAPCKAATDSCVIQFTPAPASLITCSTGYSYDAANDDYREIYICTFPAGTRIHVGCTCVPLV